MGVLNTTPGTAVAGTTLTAAFWNTEVRDALTNLQSAWTSYTPALTASTTNPTLGAGSAALGSYQRFGKDVFGTIDLSFGTSGVAAGSGVYEVSLPVTANTAAVLVGDGYFLDNSANQIYLIVGRLISATTFRMYYDLQVAATPGISATAPVVPAIQDSYRIKFQYQAA